MQSNIIKVGVVNYLNTKPLLQGLIQLEQNKIIELTLDTPANIAQLLIENQINIGLVPIAVIPLLKDAHIFSKYCIASNENVASVCLFSQVPITQLKNILLDYQSRTSVQLIKILCKHLWNIEVNFANTTQDYISEIKGDTAGVIIGDRALQNLNNFKYVYDLATAWHELTQLPFVFATWVSNIALEKTFIKAFNNANALGLTNIKEIATAQNFSAYNLEKYYTENIAYTITQPMQKAIELFLNYNKSI